jgi:uncharacterized membrane protein YkoI
VRIDRRWIAAGTVAVALGAAVTGTALAQAARSADVAPDDAQQDRGEGEDVAITGEALVRATAAALDHTGGGTVTGTEVGDEESRYEVEVTMDDGRQVDVQLDEHFVVVGDEAETGPDGD